MVGERGNGCVAVLKGILSEMGRAGTGGGGVPADVDVWVRDAAARLERAVTVRSSSMSSLVPPCPNSPSSSEDTGEL